ncbi:MAG TPA: hypothetical protein VM143_04985 [Acidimicrobiales bacterium]|nr:hypothetical protein [Acidimicrobiales bacterium]
MTSGALLAHGLGGLVTHSAGMGWDEAAPEEPAGDDGDAAE